MEEIYRWAKGIICLMLFLAVVMNLLAEEKYEKYVRFFAGMLLLLAVISPLAGGAGFLEKTADSFQSISLKEETGTFKEELLQMEEKRRQLVFSQYEEAVETDVAALVESLGYRCRKVRAVLFEDAEDARYGKVRSLWILASEKDGDGSAIRVEPVVIGDGEGKEKEKNGSLKGKVAQYYELEEADIKIQWQDDR